MKSKLLSVLTPICLLATLALGGCKGSGLGSADTDKLDVTLDTRGVTISIWTGFGSTITDYITEITDEFTAKTGIKVEHESKGGYPNLQTAINLSVTQRSYPNVALGYPDHFAGYINSNIQLRLDGLIKNDSKRDSGKKDDEGYAIDNEGIRLLNYDDFYKDYTPENENLEFDKEGKGYILGLPFNKSSEAMCYNSTFFEWAASDTTYKDKIFVPKTWAEVKSVGLAVRSLLKDKGVYGKMLASDGNVYTNEAAIPENCHKVFNGTSVTEDNFRLFSYDSTENLFITLVRQFGGTYTELDKTKTGKGYAVFNDEPYRAKTLEAMDMFKDLADNKVVGIPATFGESLYCSTPFKNYQSLLNVGSTAGVSNAVPEGGAFVTKAAPIPQNGNLENKFVISQGTNLALFNKGTDKEKVAAWKLMIYLSQQANGKFAALSGYFPTCGAATNSAEYQEYLEHAVSATAILQQQCAKVNKDIYGNAEDHWTRFVDVAFLGSSSVRQQVGFIPGYIISGELGSNENILKKTYENLPDFIH